MARILFMPHLSRLRLASRRAARKTHFLYVGKCEGAAIKDLLGRINALPAGPRIRALGHSRKLAELPPDAAYFFSVRHPVSRFVSAFSMRRRKEQPRLYQEWTAGERDAFERFPETNDLAEALFALSAAGIAAFAAMQGIGHMSSQHTCFKIRDILAARPPLCVLRQEKLARDVAHLLRQRVPGAWGDVLDELDAALGGLPMRSCHGEQERGDSRMELTPFGLTGGRLVRPQRPCVVSREAAR